MADLENMTFKELRKELARLEGNSRELNEIKASLIVNCYPGRALDKLGIGYDERKSVLNNLDRILRGLLDKINAKDS